MTGATVFAYMLANKTSKVLHIERAKGCDVRLLSFLKWWQENGTFDIHVAPDGGVRHDEEKQLSYFLNGYSNAKTLEETAHGRGGAIDLYPVGFNPSIAIPRHSLGPPNSGGTKQPVTEARFFELGAAGENFGLVWGGRWKSPYDLPHFQVPNWQRLPFPPERY